MVVGNGLVARSLDVYKDNPDVVIFASGVSNSGEVSIPEYEREAELLMSWKNSKALFVYFSTCSIFDPTLSASMYVVHKKKMEEVIRNEFSSFLILRLPLLISNSPNPFTFFNFIRNRILSKENLQVHAKAWRYLMDADDLKTLVPLIINEDSYTGQSINMAYDNASRVADIVKQMEIIAGVEAKKELVEKGSNYNFDRHVFRELLQKHNFKFDPILYNEQIIKKYMHAY
ncbi:MAG: hypothetical protein ACHQRM_17470 [Bacteroidia bacterium]